MIDERLKMDILARREAFSRDMRRLEKKNELLDKKILHYESEIERINMQIDDVDSVISELSNEFRKSTSLNSRDMSFLFFSTALQCLRWFFQPKINPEFNKLSAVERHKASEDGLIEKNLGNLEASKNRENNIKSRKYPDRVSMYLLPVPYDAMANTENVIISGVTDLGKNINGVNHHSATMGHDPILGYIFGTINILSRTITFKTPMLDTNLVHMYRGTRRQYVGQNIGLVSALERTLESVREDPWRLPAAVIRQSLHIQSDKYTKQGLPIPFISPEKAQILLNNGWNSNELERLIKFTANNVATVGIQALMSIVINIIIETLYRLLYGLGNDREEKLLQVKGKKIIMYSNTLASCSNVIYSTVSKNIGTLDIGGFIVTIYRIAMDSKMIKQIRDEFVYGGFESNLRLREYTI